MLASFASKGGGGLSHRSSSTSSEASRPPTGESRAPSEPAWSIFGAHTSQPLSSHHHGHPQGPESEPEIPSREDDVLFAGVPLIDFLDLDARPVFVVDLLAKPASTSAARATSSAPLSLPIIYHNQALQDAGNLMEVVEGYALASPYGQPAWVTYPVFRAWVLDHMRRAFAKKKSTIVYGGMTWSATTVRRRWKVLYGEAYRHPDHLTASYSNIYFSTKNVGVGEPTPAEEKVDELDRFEKETETPKEEPAEEPNVTEGPAVMTPEEPTEITTSLASLLLLEEETRRGRTIAEQAALDQQKIEEQLQIRTRELEQSELQLQHFADAVPIGIFITEFSPDNMDGRYRYRNERWFELMGDSRENVSSWKSPLWQKMHSDDIPAVEKCWRKLMQERTEESFEFRIPRVGGGQSPVDDTFKFTWILCHAFSVMTDDGWLRSIVGSVTDITTVKWAEDIQKRKMEDAIEAKRQQENFIDVTSHEMRNPLSAIMISADDIISTLRDLDRNSSDFDTIIKNSVDAAQTVLHCAQHQKRIVDDILTISKLDSGLFSINPVEVQPVALVNDLSKMFNGEYNAAGITQTICVEDSFKSLQVDWVLLDSSRLTQILINLITNSIKFTQYQSKREIKISLGASVEKPTESTEGIQYLDFRMTREDLTQRKEWGNGEELYLHFSVSDTGCGLTMDEKKLLFMRFSQAPRTMVHYGGSGLGLFICRELTELQGGSIGVESESGKGSTFAFYVKTRRRVPRTPEIPSRRAAHQIPELTALQQLQNIEQTFEQPPLHRRDQHAPSLYSHQQTRPSSPTTTTTTNTTASTHSPATSVPCSPRVFDCLIVEDNKVNQSVMSKGLVKLGHAVYVANHGVEALDFLRTTRLWCGNAADAQNLTVVLMDIEMPVMDGLTCVRKIRELEREGKLTGRVKVIAITANARVEQVNTAMEAGMDDVVSKPFRVAELISSIERLIDAREQEADAEAEAAAEAEAVQQ
ncbi:hypothetical protein GTA08_BOTSDO00203 [Neofusicoccum parvum]|nr:hypothetical protein GTA08_BOTSDO00203 [Neofusicoccum parvum]